MKIPITILLLASLFAASCGEPPMPPSDEEMIRHFATHEAAFRKVYEIMAESSEGSFHYPPLSPEEVIILDSTEQSDTFHETNDEQDIPVYGLLKPERILFKKANEPFNLSTEFVPFSISSKMMNTLSSCCAMLTSC